LWLFIIVCCQHFQFDDSRLADLLQSVVVYDYTFSLTFLGFMPYFGHAAFHILAASNLCFLRASYFAGMGDSAINAA
jgi:hypothetical protein